MPTTMNTVKQITDFEVSWSGLSNP